MEVIGQERNSRGQNLVRNLTFSVIVPAVIFGVQSFASHLHPAENLFADG